jgi:hypothetical protein
MISWPAIAAQRAQDRQVLILKGLAAEGGQLGRGSVEVVPVHAAAILGRSAG